MDMIALRRVVFAAGLALGLPTGAACVPFIEEAPSGGSASLRADASSAASCRVDEAAYRQVIVQWLQERPRSAGPVSSLALGRAQQYPWLSQHIAGAALASPGWASRVAGASAGERDRLAGFVFKDPQLVQRLGVPFEAAGYRVLGVGHEKLLFGRADVHVAGTAGAAAGAVPVPFDAQLWLRLAPRN
jgi:hypothetical protein